MQLLTEGHAEGHAWRGTVVEVAFANPTIQQSGCKIL